MRDITGYKTSRDYERLIELARTQSVVCIVDYAMQGDEPIRDVAQTLWFGVGLYREAPDISCRGHGYIYGGTTKESFIAQCQRAHVEFIEPQTPEGLKS